MAEIQEIQYPPLLTVSPSESPLAPPSAITNPFADERCIIIDHGEVPQPRKEQTARVALTVGPLATDPRPSRPSPKPRCVRQRFGKR